MFVSVGPEDESKPQCCQDTFELTVFRTYFPDFNARHQHTILVAELHEESENTTLFPIDDQLSEDDTVRTSVHGSWPPFHGGQRGRVNHKLLRSLIILRGRLKRANVASMTQLCLRICSEVLSSYIRSDLDVNIHLTISDILFSSYFVSRMYSFINSAQEYVHIAPGIHAFFCSSEAFVWRKGR